MLGLPERENTSSQSSHGKEGGGRPSSQSSAAQKGVRREELSGRRKEGGSSSLSRNASSIPRTQKEELQTVKGGSSRRIRQDVQLLPRERERDWPSLSPNKKRVARASLIRKDLIQSRLLEKAKAIYSGKSSSLRQNVHAKSISNEKGAPRT